MTATLAPETNVTTETTASEQHDRPHFDELGACLCMCPLCTIIHDNHTDQCICKTCNIPKCGLH